MGPIDGSPSRPIAATLPREDIFLAQTPQAFRRDVLLHALPIFHTHGLFVGTNVTLLAGGSMLFLSKFDADAVFRLMPRATTMMGVPTFYVRMVDDPRLTPGLTPPDHITAFKIG